MRYLSRSVRERPRRYLVDAIVCSRVMPHRPPISLVGRQRECETARHGAEIRARRGHFTAFWSAQHTSHVFAGQTSQGFATTSYVENRVCPLPILPFGCHSRATSGRDLSVANHVFCSSAARALRASHVKVRPEGQFGFIPCYHDDRRDASSVRARVWSSSARSWLVRPRWRWLTDCLRAFDRVGRRVPPSPSHEFDGGC